MFYVRLIYVYVYEGSHFENDNLNTKIFKFQPGDF